MKYHHEHLSDRAVMLAMRAALKLQTKLTFGPEARPAFDTLMAKTPASERVTYEPAVIAGVQGWWCHPQAPLAGAAILYLHGGAYVVGTAWAYRNFVGQLAARTGVAAFIPDYALAPERPFPAAFDEAVAVYDALAGDRALAIVGDSAGGGLAVALMCHVGSSPLQRPRCGALFSPWVDLSLSGGSATDRADHDPLLSRAVLAEAATLYLGTGYRDDPRASSLLSNLANLPPMLLHVGEDEVLLDDARRMADGIAQTGGDAELHVWQGMVHVFPANLAVLKAAEEAVGSTAQFLRRHLCST